MKIAGVRVGRGWLMSLSVALAPLGAGCLDDGRPLAEYLAELPLDAEVPVSDAEALLPDGEVPDAAPLEVCSQNGGAAIIARFASAHPQAVDVFWVDARCTEQPYGTLEPGASKDQGTFAGHPWRFRDARTRAVVLDWPGAPLTTAAGSVVDVVVP